MDKFARVVITAMSVECFATSVAFASAGNWKLAAYWFFASCINTVGLTLQGEVS
jgi:phosphatidylserine synthase